MGSCCWAGWTGEKFHAGMSVGDNEHRGRASRDNTGVRQIGEAPESPDCDVGKHQRLSSPPTSLEAKP